MNVTIDKKNKKVIIELDLLPEPRLSSTQATRNIAEARNVHTGVKHESGNEIKVTAQVYWPTKNEVGGLQPAVTPKP